MNPAPGLTLHLLSPGRFLSASGPPCYCSCGRILGPIIDACPPFRNPVHRQNLLVPLLKCLECSHFSRCWHSRLSRCLSWVPVCLLEATLDRNIPRLFYKWGCHSPQPGAVPGLNGTTGSSSQRAGREAADDDPQEVPPASLTWRMSVAAVAPPAPRP